MAPVTDADLIHALDTTIEAVLRRTKHLTETEQAAEVRAAVHELLTEETT